jgi:hypothetical protein
MEWAQGRLLDSTIRLGFRTSDGESNVMLASHVWKTILEWMIHISVLLHFRG